MGQINDLAENIHNISTSKGFTPPSLENLPEKLMLSVSELSECMEEHRRGRGLYYEKDGKPEGILTELADSIIRNLHMMHSLLLDYNEGQPEIGQLDIEAVLLYKVGFNAGRPYLHGEGNKY